MANARQLLTETAARVLRLLLTFAKGLLKTYNKGLKEVWLMDLMLYAYLSRSKEKIHSWDPGKAGM